MPVPAEVDSSDSEKELAAAEKTEDPNALKAFLRKSAARNKQTTAQLKTLERNVQRLHKVKKTRRCEALKHGNTEQCTHNGKECLDDVDRWACMKHFKIFIQDPSSIRWYDKPLGDLSDYTEEMLNFMREQLGMLSISESENGGASSSTSK